MRYINYLVLLLMSSHLLNAQTEFFLVPNADLDFSTECINVNINERVHFTREPSCGPSLVISPDKGITIIFSTPKVNSSYTFSELGEYVIFCNGTSDNAVPALCLNIIDPDIANLDPSEIPTMGEWGIICTFLLMAIFGTLALRSNCRELTIE